MQKIKKAFTLVELMVVIAVIAVLATVSVVGYKSYVRRENINASVTEARQIREVVISQIVADSDGKITLNIRNEAGEIYNTIDFTYENGVLQVSSEDPNAKSDTLAEIEDFDRAMRNTFPSLASLPGTLAYSGNDLFYHHLNIESIIEVLENGTITEDNLLDPGYPYEKNDVAVNIYTLTYITYIEEGRGDDGYDQIQFSISATSVYLECVEEGSASTSNIIELTYFINPRDTEISFGVIDNVYSKSDQENIATITIGEPDASGYGKIKIVAHNPTLKGEMLIGFTAKNVGRTLSIKVLEKGRLTIGAPKQITKFEYKPSADNFKVGLEQKVTPEDFGISSEKLVKTGIVEMTYDSAKTTLQQPGDTIRVKFSIKNKDYCWADDFSTDPKYITVTLDKFMLPTPTLNKKELVYNGKDQEPDSIKDDWSIGDFDT